MDNRTELLALLACPLCGGMVDAAPDAYQCAPCQASYPIREGIPLFHVEDDLWADKCGDMEGESVFNAEHVTNERHLEWNHHVIDLIQELPRWAPAISVTRPRVLAVGVGNGTEALALRDLWDAEVVGIDIVAELSVAAGVLPEWRRHYTAVGGDVEYLPFQENSFDVVFAHAALHHVERLPRALAYIFHALKPGGVFVLIGEPTRGLMQSLAARQEIDRHVLDLGHIHHYYTRPGWWWMVRHVSRDVHLRAPDGPSQRFAPDTLGFRLLNAFPRARRYKRLLDVSLKPRPVELWARKTHPVPRPTSGALVRPVTYPFRTDRLPDMAARHRYLALRLADRVGLSLEDGARAD